MLKLAKLPDRTPVKVTVTLNPDLHRALRDYTALYKAEYGDTETIADLIPYMLASFLDGDRAFTKARKSDVPASAGDPPTEKRRGRPKQDGAAEPAPVPIPVPAQPASPFPETQP